MEFPVIRLTPLKRRLLYVGAFELFATLLSIPVLMLLSGASAGESWPVAIIVSTTAVLWNYIYNTGFELWEQRQQIMTRTFRVRCVHTLGFETGLFIICLPLYMVWYGVSLWKAISMEAALLFFFLLYTFFFTWAFDKLFPLEHQNPINQTKFN